MFLPKYIHSYFNRAILKDTNEKLVKNTKTIFKSVDASKKSNFLISPLFILGLISVLLIFITYKDYKKNVRRKWLDVILFVITGLTGIAILLLWFATDHTATAYNYNLLWAFPLNLFMLGQVLKTSPKAWFKKYLKLLLIILCLMLLHWIMGIQVFSIGLIPIIIALVIRYIYLIKIL